MDGAAGTFLLDINMGGTTGDGELLEMQTDGDGQHSDDDEACKCDACGTAEGTQDPTSNSPQPIRFFKNHLKSADILCRLAHRLFGNGLPWKARRQHMFTFLFACPTSRNALKASCRASMQTC